MLYPEYYGRTRLILSLHWRHNNHDGVLNHQPHGCLLNRVFRRRSKKHQSSASLAFVWGIHRDRWIPHTKGQLREKCFHLMTSSWCLLLPWLFASPAIIIYICMMNWPLFFKLEDLNVMCHLGAAKWQKNANFMLLEISPQHDGEFTQSIQRITYFHKRPPCTPQHVAQITQ